MEKDWPGSGSKLLSRREAAFLPCTLCQAFLHSKHVLWNGGHMEHQRGNKSDTQGRIFKGVPGQLESSHIQPLLQSAMLEQGLSQRPRTLRKSNGSCGHQGSYPNDVYFCISEVSVSCLPSGGPQVHSTGSKWTESLWRQGLHEKLQAGDSKLLRAGILVRK